MPINNPPPITKRTFDMYTWAEKKVIALFRSSRLMAIVSRQDLARFSADSSVAVRPRDSTSYFLARGSRTRYMLSRLSLSKLLYLHFARISTLHSHASRMLVRDIYAAQLHPVFLIIHLFAFVLKLFTCSRCVDYELYCSFPKACLLCRTYFEFLNLAYCINYCAMGHIEWNILYRCDIH